MTAAASTPAKPRRKQARTIRAQAAFLKKFGECGTHTHSCEAAGVTRNALFDWLHNDTEFQDMYEHARERFEDELEAEAFRRAREGWDEPVYQGGKLVGTKRMHSDRMLELMLKAKLPEYRDKHEITGKDGAPLLVTWLP